MKTNSKTETDMITRLTKLGANNVFLDLCEDLLLKIPTSAVFYNDTWNIVDWAPSPGNATVKNVRFGRVLNQELRLAIKLWVLDGRLKKNWGPSSCFSSLSAALSLDSVIHARSILTLKTSDFKKAEHELSKHYAVGTAFRLSAALQNLSKFLCKNFGLRLNYRSAITNPAVYGRYGTDDGRFEKLLPNEVLGDLLRSRNEKDLSQKDRFFLSVMAIILATGFRVTELATLPAECMLRLDGGLYILHYPRKDGQPVPRPVHPWMAEVVEDAINDLLQMTREARQAVKDVETGNIIDVSKVMENNDAFRYFVAKWASQWTAEPKHLMINPDGAWWNKENCFVDILGEIEKAGSKSQAAKNLGMSRNTVHDLEQDQLAAQRGQLPAVKNSKSKGKARNSWDTDNRVISFRQLEGQWGIALKSKARSVIKDIIEEAQECQLKGQVYAVSAYSEVFESLNANETARITDVHGDSDALLKEFESLKRQSRPLLRDKNGRGFLHQHEALLVIEKYAFSESYTTRTGEFSTITSGQIMRWLSGEKRSAGTGNAEDSVFSRLKIIDPRTGDFTKLTTHDIRHWLNTVYQNGGLTDDQIALIFNRKYRSQNAIYDQTSSKVRTERIKQAVRDGIAVGRVSDTYNLLCEFSRAEAETYLSAVTRMLNAMPHGACMLDWSTNPCPHYLSCFSCESEEPGPCEHLVVDPRNDDHVAEIKQINREAGLVISAIESQGFEDSPQIDHFRKIRSNTGTMLERISIIQLDD